MLKGLKGIQGGTAVVVIIIPGASEGPEGSVFLRLAMSLPCRKLRDQLGVGWYSFGATDNPQPSGPSCNFLIGKLMNRDGVGFQGFVKAEVLKG